MANDTTRSLQSLQGGRVTPGNSYVERKLGSSVREHAVRQAGYAALLAHGAALTQRVIEDGAERFRESVRHHYELLDQVKASGDPTQVAKMERFIDYSLNIAADVHVRTGRACGETTRRIADDFAGTIRRLLDSWSA